MRLQSILRLSFATIAAASAFACSEGSSLTGPRTTSVDVRFSHYPGDGGKNAKAATCVARHEDRQSARIGSNGGTLRIGNNTLVVPAGALSAEIEITGHAIPSNSARLEFSPSGLQFAIPATLTMSYAKCATPLFGVTIAYLQADSVTEVEPSREHLLQRTVSAQIRHFSSYAVAY